jgi:hypothetical protein
MVQQSSLWQQRTMRQCLMVVCIRERQMANCCY